MAHGTCSIEGCDTEDDLRRGWCNRHYARWRTHGDPTVTVLDPSPEARIRAQTAVQDDGCWVYTGQPSTRYPEVRIDGVRHGIHRWSYERHHGPIPDGHHVDHMCRHTHCWNPDHLRTLTALDNARDNVRANAHAAKSHCVNGHRLDGDNVYRPPSQPSRRMCRQCRYDQKRKVT